MNLSENFQEMADTMKRPVAIAALALSAFTLAGCASGGKLNLPETNVGGIPVGRVLNQNTNQNIYEAKKGLRDGIAGAARFTPCPIQPEQPRTQGPGLLGILGGFVDKTFSVNTTVSVGDSGCTGTTGILPAPVAPAVGSPRGGVVQPRPQ